jgi:uncharacterized protein with von Willebrand factor type A (vWA) domain
MMGMSAGTGQGMSPGRAVALLGDARHGKFPENLGAFGRALRRAGVPVDASRMALALAALQCVGLDRKQDVGAALEAVFISREQDRAVFRELFDAFFRDPELARQLLARMLPGSKGAAAPARVRVREALSPVRLRAAVAAAPADIEHDAAMTASHLERLKTADFNQLTAREYALVERLVREIPLPVPAVPGRRPAVGLRGPRLHWGRTLREAARSGGDPHALYRWQRRRQPLPLLMLVDVSGSMERYTRTLLAFLHAATARVPVGGRRLPIRRDIFAFGTGLTDLGRAFRLADTDAMLRRAGELIRDFAGGTRLGECLAELRRHHARRLVGRRTLVLIVSDGLDCGEPHALEQELAWLRLHVRSLLWLNPLLRYAGYEPTAQGAAALHRAADGMLAVHNVTRLQELAGAMAALMKPH